MPTIGGAPPMAARRWHGAQRVLELKSYSEGPELAAFCRPQFWTLRFPRRASVNLTALNQMREVLVHE